MSMIEVKPLSRKTIVHFTSENKEINLILEYDVDREVVLEVGKLIKDAIKKLPINHICPGEITINIDWKVSEE